MIEAIGANGHPPLGLYAAGAILFVLALLYFGAKSRR